MKTLKCFIVILFFIFKSGNDVNGDCLLSLNENFGSPHPVLLQNGDFLKPNAANGNIAVRKAATVIVACTGNKNFIVLGNTTTDFDVVEAKCMREFTFRIGRWVGPFQQIRCRSQPWFDAEFTDRTCYGGNSIVRVGYQVQDTFYKQYEVCFDRIQLSAVYSKHTLTPYSYYSQKTPRPNFSEGNIFGKVRMSRLYRTSYQKTRINAILGDGMDQEYITKKQFLNRGHLSPKADFSMASGQRASFHYVNVAPQWMRGNAGDWAALEEGLRRRIKSYGSEVTVFTGTHGVVTLTDRNEKPQKIYLYTDANNNNAVPVPLYFYKLVYDPRKKTAAAFVLINSSYYNKSATDELTFCLDDCSRHSWLTWRNDGTHSFCCTYDELTSGIDSVPKLDVTREFQ